MHDEISASPCKASDRHAKDQIGIDAGGGAPGHWGHTKSTGSTRRSRSARRDAFSGGIRKEVASSFDGGKTGARTQDDIVRSSGSGHSSKGPVHLSRVDYGYQGQNAQ
eukprot:1935433-Amphidinium_carterae.1